jgi:hypothetical protein
VGKEIVAAASSEAEGEVMRDCIFFREASDE